MTISDIFQSREISGNFCGFTSVRAQAKISTQPHSPRKIAKTKYPYIPSSNTVQLCGYGKDDASIKGNIMITFLSDDHQ